MALVGRREILRASGLLVASPMLLASTGARASFSANTPTGPVPAMPLNKDLMLYFANQHASSVAQILSSAGSIDHRAMTKQWNLLANHMEDIGFDDQIKAVLPALISSGQYSSVGKEFYYPAIDSAVGTIQQYGITVTRDQFIAGLGALPTGDLTQLVQSIAAKGLSAHCRAVADRFEVMAHTDVHKLPAHFGYGTAEPHLQRICWKWKGNTKEERYRSCYDGETGIAMMIVGGGGLICLAIPACAAGLIGLGAVGGFIGVGGTLAALAAWLIGKYCAPILAYNGHTDQGTELNVRSPSRVWKEVPADLSI